jgi:hypothetical protein
VSAIITQQLPGILLNDRAGLNAWMQITMEAKAKDTDRAADMAKTYYHFVCTSYFLNTN